jgi:hypothetical protein
MIQPTHVLHADEVPLDVPATLHAPGEHGRSVVMALPSTWCLAATIDTAGLPRNDRRAGVYRLEDKLPIAAEDITADFVWHASSALGVCVKTNRLTDRIAALESAGVAVQTIAPAALLAAQAAGASGCCVLLIGGEDGVDVVATEGGLPLAWAWTAADLDDIKLQIDLVSTHLAAAPRIVAIAVNDVILNGLTDGTGRRLATTLDHSVPDLIDETARSILEGRTKPWIDLRRGALAPPDRARACRRALNFALASAIALLLAIAAASFIRGARYQSAARRAEFAMVAEFGRRFPGWPVPANVRAVVESEARRRASGAAESPDGSALTPLRAVLGAIPVGLAVSLETMSFDAYTFEFSGRVNDQSDLQSLATAARAAGYEVPPALTRREPDGTWSFTLSGTKRQPGRPPAVAVRRGP